MFKKFFAPKRASMTVVLNSDAVIVDIKSDIRELKLNKDDVLGKSWFDTFIEPMDRDKVMNVFSGLLNGDTKIWHTYQNDIRSSDGKHLFLDFKNVVKIKNGEKFIVSKGVLHYEN